MIIKQSIQWVSRLPIGLDIQTACQSFKIVWFSTQCVWFRRMSAWLFRISLTIFIIYPKDYLFCCLNSLSCYSYHEVLYLNYQGVCVVCMTYQIASMAIQTVYLFVDDVGLPAQIACRAFQIVWFFKQSVWLSGQSVKYLSDLSGYLDCALNIQNASFPIYTVDLVV